jgi:hypothetical protein
VCMDGGTGLGKLQLVERPAPGATSLLVGVDVATLVTSVPITFTGPAGTPADTPSCPTLMHCHRELDRENWRPCVRRPHHPEHALRLCRHQVAPWWCLGAAPLVAR